MFLGCDNMKNKKGFTLIELTAVIVLIGLIAIIASIPINKMVKDSKAKLYDSQLDQIILAVQNWSVDNTSILPPFTEDGKPASINIETLISNGYLEEEVLDNFTKCSYVEISLSGESENPDTNSYKYNFVIEDTCE